MKKVTKLFALACLMVLISSCKNEKSLQSYLVESQEKAGFMYGDLPVGSMLTAKTEVSDEVKETMKSIKKINIAFLRKTDDNTAAYEAEKATLKNIFTSDAYKSLGRVKAKGMNVNMYYSGDTNAIDEIIAFGYSKKAGVGVARLLGDNMNPAKILEMMNSVKLDGDNLESFSAIFQAR